LTYFYNNVCVVWQDVGVYLCDRVCVCERVFQCMCVVINYTVR